MKDEPASALTGMERIVEMEAILDLYPDVPADQVQRVLHWFNKEASAHDVAMLASNPLINEGYRKFRSDHIDRLTLPDAIKAAGWAALPVLAAAAIFLFR